MRKLFFVGLCVALLAGAACSTDNTTEPRAFEAAQAGCADRDGAQETLKLTVLAPTGPLDRGSIAKLKVHVVRNADIAEQLEAELPALKASGPSTEVPVEGAIVQLSLSVPDAPPLWGGAVTDGDGNATVEIKVKSSATPGIADGTSFAWREVFDGPCVHIVETGYFHKEAFATIK